MPLQILGCEGADLQFETNRKDAVTEETSLERSKRYHRSPWRDANQPLS